MPSIEVSSDSLMGGLSGGAPPLKIERASEAPETLLLRSGVPTVEADAGGLMERRFGALAFVKTLRAPNRSE